MKSINANHIAPHNHSLSQFHCQKNTEISLTSHMCVPNLYQVSEIFLIHNKKSSGSAVSVKNPALLKKCSGATATDTVLKRQRRYRYRYKKSSGATPTSAHYAHLRTASVLPHQLLIKSLALLQNNLWHKSNLTYQQMSLHQIELKSLNFVAFVNNNKYLKTASNEILEPIETQMNRQISIYQNGDHFT